MSGAGRIIYIVKNNLKFIPEPSLELLKKENYNCINVSDGFEGNQENVGWKRCGLPC